MEGNHDGSAHPPDAEGRPAAQELAGSSRRFESAGASVRGVEERRGNPANDQDAFYSASKGFHFAEIGFDKDKIDERTGLRVSPSETTRVNGLVEALSELDIRDAQGNRETITDESIARTHQAVQELLERGSFRGIDVVADGVGGNAAGERASSIATYIFVHEIAKTLQSEGEISNEVMQRAVKEADRILHAYNVKDDKNSETTLVAHVTDKNGQTFITSVGDSRVYKKDSFGEIVRITQDQSFVEPLLWGQRSTFSEALNHPQRSGIFNSIGVGNLSDANIQVYMENLRAGEELYLVCDGVWEAVRGNSDLLSQADSKYQGLIESGIDREKALNEVYGFLFKEFNLKDAPANDLEALAIYLTRPEIGELSHDNVTAVVVRASGSDLPYEESTEEPVVVDLQSGSAAETNPQMVIKGYLQPGARVKVRRSSGDIERNWAVVGLTETGFVKVEKTGKDALYEKEITQADMDALNPPITITDIPEAEDIGELIYMIGQLRGINGPDHYYSASELETIIREAEQGSRQQKKKALERLPSVGGLKQRVTELTSLVKVRKMLRAFKEYGK